jgi:RsiW-degrading membrane proteinase PrsW (M82 family)
MLGIITAFGALFLELLIFTFFNLDLGAAYPYSDSLSWPLIFSAFLEESVKIIILYQILKKIIQAGMERKNIFLSALMAGLGFSLTEILFYLFNSQINSHLSFRDVFGLLVVHTGTFAILGYALAKKTGLNFPRFALFFPVIFLFHLFYNSLILYQWNSGFYWLFTISSLILILVFWRDLKRHSLEKNLPKSEIRL